MGAPRGSYGHCGSGSAQAPKHNFDSLLSVCLTRADFLLLNKARCSQRSPPALTSRFFGVAAKEARGFISVGPM